MDKKALIMYVPNLHAGYDQLINDVKPEIIRLLDQSVIARLVQNDKSKARGYLERSFPYARPAEDIRMLIKHVWKDMPVGILYDTDESLVRNLREMEIRQYNFVMPEEDVSHYFHYDYLRYLDGSCEFSDKVFLRYNKRNADIGQQPFGEAVTDWSHVSPMLQRIMERAAKEADKSDDWWRQVGAVLFDESSGEILLAGYNKHLPDGHHRYAFGDSRASFQAGYMPELVTAIHAEQRIVVEALNRGISFKGKSLYTSTYPCPYCSNMIALSGITKLYFSEGYSVMEQGRNLFAAYGIETICLHPEAMKKAAT